MFRFKAALYPLSFIPFASIFENYISHYFQSQSIIFIHKQLKLLKFRAKWKNTIAESQQDKIRSFLFYFLFFQIAMLKASILIFFCLIMAHCYNQIKAKNLTKIGGPFSQAISEGDKFYLVNQNYVTIYKIENSVNLKGQSIALFPINGLQCSISAVTNKANLLLVARKCPLMTNIDLVLINSANYSQILRSSISNNYNFDKIIAGKSSINEFLFKDTEGLYRFLFHSENIVLYKLSEPHAQSYFFDEFSKISYIISQNITDNKSGLLIFKANRFLPHDLNIFEINSIQQTLMANGFYFAQFFEISQSSILKIYHISTKNYIFSDNLEFRNAVYHKINETHILIAGSDDKNSYFRVYDLINLQCVVDLIFQGHLNRNQSLEWVFFMKERIIFKLDKQIYQIQYELVQEKVCVFPMDIVDGKYCVQCDVSCFTCSVQNGSICEECIYGYQLNKQFKCVEASAKYFYDFLTFPGLIILFDSMAPIFRFTDHFWLFQTLNITYNYKVKGILQAIRETNIKKFVPTIFLRPNPLLQPQQTNFRTSMTFSSYFHIFKHSPFFINYQKQVYLYGIVYNICIFFTCILLSLIFRRTTFGRIFQKCSVFGVFVMECFGHRISYVGFQFFAEIVLISSENFQQKFSAIFIAFFFFVILIYCLAFYVLLEWHYQTQNNLLYFCSHLKNIPQTFLYKNLQNLILLIESCIFGLLFSETQLQIICLLCCSVLKIILIIFSWPIFETKVQLFIYFFYRVIVLLFMIVLLMHSRYQWYIFEVDVREVEMFLLVFAAGFVMLQIVFNFYIAIWKSIRAYQSYKEQQRQEKTTAITLYQILQQHRGRNNQRQPIFMCNKYGPGLQKIQKSFRKGKRTKSNYSYNDILLTDIKKRMTINKFDKLNLLKQLYSMKNDLSIQEERKAQSQQQSRSQDYNFGHEKNVKELLKKSRNQVVPLDYNRSICHIFLHKKSQAQKTT